MDHKHHMNKNLPLIMSAVILILATVYFVIQKNYEFLIYAATLSVLITALYFLDLRFNFLPVAKWSFMLWMAMHMAGGALYFSSTRLYDIILIPLFGSPYNILKYDQLVHLICYIVMALLVYSVLLDITRPKADKLIFAVILVLAASSIGAFNEIIELSAVIMFESQGVGGYFNTALDLVFNLIGAVIGTFYLKFVKGSVLA